MRPGGIGVASIFAVASFSCSRAPYPEVAVSFDASSDEARSTRVARSSDPLRLSVAAMLSPRGTYAAYAAIARSISMSLGREIELVQQRTYGEANAQLTGGAIDIAFLCTGAYLNLLRRSPSSIELLAIPVVNGKTTYDARIIVAADGARRFEELRGTRFAFTDELSLTGRAWAVSLLRAHGEQPGSFFGSTLFSRSHDRSIRAVSRGLVDAAAVDGLIYDQLRAAEPELRSTTREILRSPELGMPPVVASTRVPRSQRERLRGILLELHNSASGVEALKAAGVDRFALPGPNEYDSAMTIVLSID